MLSNIVITEHETGGYSAHTQLYISCLRGYGATPNEAIGDLVTRWKDMLSIVITGDDDDA